MTFKLCQRIKSMFYSFAMKISARGVARFAKVDFQDA